MIGGGQFLMNDVCVIYQCVTVNSTQYNCTILLVFATQPSHQSYLSFFVTIWRCNRILVTEFVHEATVVFKNRSIFFFRERLSYLCLQNPDIGIVGRHAVYHLSDRWDVCVNEMENVVHPNIVGYTVILFPILNEYFQGATHHKIPFVAGHKECAPFSATYVVVIVDTEMVCIEIG